MRLPGNFPRFLKPATRHWWPLRVTARRRTLQQAAQRFHQVRVVINDQYVMAERVNEFRLHAFAPPLDLLSFLCNYNAQRAPGGKRIATKLKDDVRARDERGFPQHGWSLSAITSISPGMDHRKAGQFAAPTGSSCTRAAVASACLRMSSLIRIEQNSGPHMLQKAAVLKASCGSVSSCILRAVSGSSERRNWSFQLKLYRARLRASSRSRAPARWRARSAACAAIL